MAILASIEKVLMETGVEYNLVLARLQANNITLMDCCADPKYLNKILIDVFDEKSKEIVHRIIENLRYFDDSKEISGFLEKLRGF